MNLRKRPERGYAASTMPGAEPPDPAAVTDRGQDVPEDRASLLDAAASASSATSLTGTRGVVLPPVERPAIRPPGPQDLLPRGTQKWATDTEEKDPFLALLRARVAAVAKDPVAHAQAELELARGQRDAGEAAAAVATCNALLSRKDGAFAGAAHAMLRRLAREAGDVDAELTHLDAMIAHAPSSARADLLAERAARSEVRGGPSPESLERWRAAIAQEPAHAAAIAGLEAALELSGHYAELVEHLERIAERIGDAELAAWLHVERAHALDARLHDRGRAAEAFTRALALASGIGPVRDACVMFAARHRDDARLSALLDEEAQLEADPARAARLELDAAILAKRCEDPARATKLLERALARARTTPLVDARVVDELLELHEQAGRHADVLRLRRIRLAFVTGQEAEARALRAVAAAAERAGDPNAAVLALERARMAAPDDEELLAELDRLLEGLGRPEQRAVMWVREAARREDEGARAEALLLAASAARAAGRAGDALKHLQAAWLATPGADEVLDAITAALSAASPPEERERAKQRAAMFTRAADATTTKARKVFYLEKAAWIWDEVIGDADLAARAYEAVLALEPTRASALVGLQSCAARAGDGRALARALLAEAETTRERVAQEALSLRAASALAPVDAPQALSLAERLARSPDTSTARAALRLRTRIHASRGQWELALEASAARAERAEGAELTTLLLEQAETLLTHLAAPARALRAALRAYELAPTAPATRDMLLRAARAVGDEDRLRTTLEHLAESATDASERAALLLRAAEIEERRPGGDARAVALYEAACAEVSDEWIHARLRRIGARAEVAPAFLSPLERATALLDSDVPSAGASDAAERLLGSTVPATPALRVAERLARAAAAAPLLANVFVMQADAFVSPLAQMRGLVALGNLLERTQPAREGAAPWDRVLEAGSQDRAALECVVRRAWRPALGGDVASADLVCEALRRLTDLSLDDVERAHLCLDAALALERSGRPHAAVAWLAEARRLQPSSLTAALALARVANATGDRAAGVAAARSLAEACTDHRSRAELLRDAADLSLASGDEASAADLLDGALAADPDAVLVAARLAELRRKAHKWDALSQSLSRALRNARTAEAIVPMASELASVAREHTADALGAIAALERAREVARTHTPTLLSLAELYIGQRAWPKALETLSEIVETARETSERHVALMGIAAIESKVLGNPSGAQNALRAALVIDDAHPRALRMFVETFSDPTNDERTSHLAKLAAVEPDPAARRRALLELADARLARGETAEVEAALVEASAASQDNTTLSALGKLAGKDRAALARLMSRALARARELGVQANPAWLAMLGELEVDVTSRPDKGVELLQEALRLDTTMHAARLPLATALVGLGRHEEAAATVMPILGAERSPAIGALRREPRMVRLLETALSGMGRNQEALAVRELRAITGDLDDASLLALDARRHAYAELDPIGALTLFEYVLPEEGRHAALLAAAACAPLAGKMARVSLAELGASTRERVKPRALVPLRGLFDRAVRAFGITEDVELAVSDAVGHASVAVEDDPWIVLPSSYALLPEPRVMATLGRLLVRVSLGVPWLHVLPRQTVAGIVAAWMRVAAPDWAARSDVEEAAIEYEPRARRALDRKRRKLLEELAPRLADAPPLASEALVSAIERTEARAAYLLGGDLRWALEQVTASDASLGQSIRVGGQAALVAILGHPVARDLVRWALGSDAVALRRGLGTLWA